MFPPIVICADNSIGLATIGGTDDVKFVITTTLGTYPISCT